MALPGNLGYVACPGAVMPVELSTGTPEAAIDLHLTGTPAPGDFAMAASSGGRWAYVVTTDGGQSGAGAVHSPGAAGVTGVTGTTPGLPNASPSGSAGRNVVVPVNLVTQRAGAPITLPGSGLTHGIVVMPGGRTVLAASGTEIVPVDVANRRVGRPIDLGASHQIYGMALDSTSSTLYVLVAGGVIPVDTADSRVGTLISTGLLVSSVYSSHGIVVTANGSTIYVVGQGGSNYGGRVLPIDAATGALQPEASFDRFGIATPASVAVTPDGSTLLVVDSANNWVDPLSASAFSSPSPPVRLPVDSAGGTQHPTDVVMGPRGTTAYVVAGFDTVIPFDVATRSFGHPLAVCRGAASMIVAVSPAGHRSSQS